jgi:hypothetical protein
MALNLAGERGKKIGEYPAGFTLVVRRMAAGIPGISGRGCTTADFQVVARYQNLSQLSSRPAASARTLKYLDSHSGIPTRLPMVWLRQSVLVIVWTPERVRPRTGVILLPEMLCAALFHCNWLSLE